VKSKNTYTAVNGSSAQWAGSLTPEGVYVIIDITVLTHTEESPKMPSQSEALCRCLPIPSPITSESVGKGELAVLINAYLLVVADLKNIDTILVRNEITNNILLFRK